MFKLAVLNSLLSLAKQREKWWRNIVQEIREVFRIERSAGQFNYLAQNGLDSGSILSLESSATNSHGENNA